MGRTLQSQLDRIHELRSQGYTLKQIAGFIKLSYGTVRVYSHLLREKFNKNVKGMEKCPECHNTIQKTYDGAGETVCTSCGLVVKTDEVLSPGAELFGRAPEHPLLWNRNLGSDERQLLTQLKKALNLKISSRDLRTDDSYIRYAMELLAKKLMQHSLGWGETAKVARAVRGRVKGLVTEEKVAQVVDEVYAQFFPNAGGVRRRLKG